MTAAIQLHTMIYLILVFMASLIGAMAGWRAGGVRWCVAGGVTVGLLAGVVHSAEPTLFRAENGPMAAFLVFGMPSLLVGLGAGLAVRITRR
jgi:hypothetical protein